MKMMVTPVIIRARLSIMSVSSWYCPKVTIIAPLKVIMLPAMDFILLPGLSVYRKEIEDVLWNRKLEACATVVLDFQLRVG